MTFATAWRTSGCRPSLWFFTQSESFLSYQRGLEERRKTSNRRTLFGMAAIRTDNHIRAMLDPVHPSHLPPAFDGVLETMRRRDGLAPFRRMGGRVLIALVLRQAQDEGDRVSLLAR